MTSLQHVAHGSLQLERRAWDMWRHCQGKIRECGRKLTFVTWPLPDWFSTETRIKIKKYTWHNPWIDSELHLHLCISLRGRSGGRNMACNLGDRLDDFISGQQPRIQHTSLGYGQGSKTIVDIQRRPVYLGLKPGKMNRAVKDDDWLEQTTRLGSQIPGYPNRNDLYLCRY